MRILYHHRTQAEDAQGVHIYEMVRAFRELGHDVEVVALVEVDQASGRKTRGAHWKWLTRWGPNWLYELMGLLYNLYSYRRLCRMIRSKRPDLIYERYSMNTFCGVWASRRFRIPLVLEVNAPLYYEHDALGTLSFKRLARFSERWVCSNSTWTIVVSHVMKEYLMREGVEERKIVVMPNGIDPREFHPGVSGEAVRRQYGLEDKVVIGFVGWFRPWHGLDMLLELMHQAGLADRGVQLMLVGDGPAYRVLYRYVEQHDLGKAVIFTGPVKRQDVAAHIAAMDIAVQPSATAYACPMKIFEYMAMGKCIVAPDQPNIREFLGDGVNGYLFRPGDQDQFSAVLLKAIQDPAARQIVGHRAYETVHQKRYLWSANAETALDLVFGSARKQESQFSTLNGPRT